MGQCLEFLCVSGITEEYIGVWDLIAPHNCHAAEGGQEDMA